MSLATIKKGDTVILHMFTGIAVAVKEVVDADKATITVETNKGLTKFSRKTSKQIEPEVSNERFANYLTEDDGSFVPRHTGRPKKNKKAEEDEEVKPVKKTKSAKKTKKVVEEDFDEDEYEEE